MPIKNDYFKKFDGNSNRELDFMQNGIKKSIREILGQTLQLDAYGIITGARGDYVAMHFRQYPENFYFGGEVIAEKIKEIDKDGMHEELKKENVAFELKFSKNGNEYIDMIIGD